jgi:hypothetical protein
MIVRVGDAERQISSVAMNFAVDGNRIPDTASVGVKH